MFLNNWIHATVIITKMRGNEMWIAKKGISIDTR